VTLVKKSQENGLAALILKCQQSLTWFDIEVALVELINNFSFFKNDF
jgi:hypothetical protein